MLLYKSQVLSYIESGTPGYYHTALSVIRLLDRVQERFLRKLQLSEEDALLYFNLAPLCSRRDIAMLGLLHRITLGLAPPQLTVLFPFQHSTQYRYSTRLAIRRHAFQFIEPIFHTDIFRRSLFGLTVIYNLLSSSVIQAKTVKQFQHNLQAALMKASSEALSRWQWLFSPSNRPCDAFTFQRFF